MIKILIIEDALNIRERYSEKLKKNRFTISLATDGTEGLQKAFKEHPDIILLDLLTPKIDGMSIMKKIRQDPWGSKVPFIILTSTTPEADSALQTIMEVQPAYYLMKSLATPEEVLEKVKEVLLK